MNIPVPGRYVTTALLVVMVAGFAGWGAPFVLTPDAGGGGYTVKHVYIQTDDRVTVATLYLPDGDEVAPGIVFGAGSGTTPALYHNYGAALATNGFAVLIAGQTRELEAGKPIRWETRRESSVLFEQAEADYHNWVSYLMSHPKVDESRLVIGGHSGGANSAYRVAYERPDVDGVVAIAGRFPPERDDRLETNLLLATGSEDSLVPPSKLTTVSEDLTGTPLQPGQQVGSFEDGTARSVVDAEGATHLSETDNPKLVRVTTEFALQSTGEAPPADLGITVRSIGTVLYQLLFGIVGVLTATALAKRIVSMRFDNRRQRDAVVAVTWLVGFAMVVHTTLSQRIYYVGPMPEQGLKYVLLAALLLTVGVALDRLASVTSWDDTTAGSTLFDLGFLLFPVGVFVLLSTQFVTFQLVTTTVLSSFALGLLGVFLAVLAVLNVHRRLRWAVIGLGLLWLVPAIVPPYL